MHTDLEKMQAVISSVRTIRAEIKASVNDPIRLSDLGIKAITLNSYLGDYLGELKHEYETTRSESFYGHYADKPSIAYAENLTRCDTAELRGRIAQVETLHKDIERIVSTIQTKIRILEAQMKGAV